ncbi:DNA-binding protein [Dysgonamonadaceae bacterium]|jgi:AraC-like DNA-binding protein|nr:DNA-binding protein [Dysgonamonadaceae bacterium]
MNFLPIDIKDKMGEGLTFKISRFKEQIKKTKPHKHEEYYELIFLSEGEGFHTIEENRFVVSTPEFYLLKPLQLHYWQFTSIPRGFVIQFKLSEFDDLNENTLLDMIRNLSEIKRIRFTAENYPDALLNEIFEEFQVNSSYSREIIHGLLTALFGKLLQIAAVKNSNTAHHETLYERFISLLMKECPQLHKVSEYADKLFVTPQNLNAVCRKQAGKSAREIVTAQLMLEAKRYLLHTDHTVGEISEIMNFTDTSNFVKFFKKHEKITPAQFRSQYFH